MVADASLWSQDLAIGSGGSGAWKAARSSMLARGSGRGRGRMQEIDRAVETECVR